MNFLRLTLVFCFCASLLGCDEWAGWDIERPSDEARVILDATPFIQPQRVCVDPASVDAPADAELVDGQLCVWDMFSGAVPEGMRFSDVSSCEAPWTQGPPWFAKPARVYESPASLLDDEAWVAEATWVQEQVHAVGCGCCHASSSESGNTSGFDFDAPGVWTDTMTNAQLIMSGGYNDLHRLFGEVPVEDNHGFARSETLFPSTDPARLKAFFESEFERRGGTAEDIAESDAAFLALFGQVIEDRSECVAEFEGVDSDGVVYWNGDDSVRQILLMEVDADTPAFPPNLDRPEGTLWALYVDFEGTPIENGALRIGEVPDGTTQMVPENGPAPVLEDGVTYSIFAARDIMAGRVLNCTFTYSAGN
ncbi:MAG: hypothetical protein KDA24_26085 [Deltaproteobacteria bacterium]|nr:hypothetical protein [Deltaproteobacteria bacterium]